MCNHQSSLYSMPGWYSFSNIWVVTIRDLSSTSAVSVMQGCDLRKLKGAQCSEPVKSRVLIAYDLYEFSSHRRAKVGHQQPPGSARAQPCDAGTNMFIRRWGVQHRCSIWTLPLFQSWGFWPQILHQTAVFLNAERDMLLDLNKFPVPRVGNLTMLKKFTCRTFALNPPPSLSVQRLTPT